MIKLVNLSCVGINKFEIQIKVHKYSVIFDNKEIHDKVVGIIVQDV